MALPCSCYTAVAYRQDTNIIPIHVLRRCTLPCLDTQLQQCITCGVEHNLLYITPAGDHLSALQCECYDVA